MGKPVRFIPSETIAAFSSYPWPGNVRELQNLIERAVIRSNDGVLSNTLPVLDWPRVRPQRSLIPTSASRTLSDCTRSIILGTLKDTGWVIGGSDGAAARLGLPRTSLISKMKKLGISRPRAGSVTTIVAESTETAGQC